MNINRHNYEEFFLLYVDNELTEAERAEVEAFVKQQPDLAEELTLLQEAALAPDESIEFTNKELLYKSEQSIGINNYEDYFVEYVNNELKASDRNEVEKFVLQHPHLQTEFTLLQKTKLEPEVIEFENKSTLYRREERRVIPMAWMRMAAAAVVIGIIGTLWISYSGNDTKISKPVAVIEPKNNSVTPKSKIVEPNKPVEVPARNLDEIAATNHIKKHITTEKKVVPVENVEEIALKQKAVKKQTTLPSDNLNQLPVPENNPVYALNSSKNPTLVKSATEEPIETVGKNASTLNANYANNNRNAIENTSSLSKQAVYKEIDNSDEEDKTIFIGGAEINRNKLRGLFKKAANFFDKKTRKTDGDNTVQIASFEIKTK